MDYITLVRYYFTTHTIIMTRLITKSKSKSKIYYKITNKSEKHNDFQYKNGLNTLIKPFAEDVKAECVPGGLYFSDKQNLHLWYGFGHNIREVTLPADAKIIKLTKKYRTNKLIFGKKYKLYSSIEPKPYKLQITKEYVRHYLGNSTDSIDDQLIFLKKYRNYITPRALCEMYQNYGLVRRFRYFLNNDVFPEKALIQSMDYPNEGSFMTHAVRKYLYKQYIKLKKI